MPRTMTDCLRAVFLRDLKSLADSVEAYGDDHAMWSQPCSISNSGGNLALHLAGNIQHFIGAKLGKSGYVRDRNREFTTCSLSRGEILKEVQAARECVDKTLENVTDEDLGKPFPIGIDGVHVETGDFLLHLSSHLAYHLGQLDYHRRGFAEEAPSVNAVSIPALFTFEKSDA